MRVALRAFRIFGFVCLGAAWMVSRAHLCAQAPAEVTLSGAVLDPSGAFIPGATVTLHAEAADRSATSDKMGHFVLSAAPGRYVLVVSAEGFRTYTQQAFNVGARIPALKITLRVAAKDEQVNVDSDSGLSNDADANKSALVFKGDQLNVFSDDPATMQQQLLALAGGDPTSAPQIYVDGFSNGSLPPKESIREIRINQNPFSAAWDQFGLGRIEVFTKPGSNKLHGSIDLNMGSSALDTNAFNALHALNPYVSTPGQPSYLYSQVNGALSGPLGKKSSFYLNFTRNELANNALISALTTLDGNNNAVAFTAAVPNPTLTQVYSVRFDRQLGKSDTLIARYTFNDRTATNSGVGQQVLADNGLHTSTQTQTLQLTETRLFGTKIVLDSGLQYIRTRTRENPNSTAPGISVEGAFSGGGNGSQVLDDHNEQTEIHENLTISHGTHFIRTGIRSRLNREASFSNADYNGVFTFPSLLSYVITAQDLALGYKDAQVRADCRYDSTGTQYCGGATQLSIATGIPKASLFSTDTEGYAEDEWKVTPIFTLTYGLRMETQSPTPRHLDVGPRLQTAWSIHPDKKTKAPLFVLRNGFGIFFQRFPAANVLTSLRQNGTSQLSYLIANPSSDTYNPTAARLTPPNAVSSTPPTPYRINPDLKLPTQYQYYGALEHAFGKFASLTLGGYVRRTEHMFESLNINAPLNGPGSARPLGGTQDIYEFSADGVSNGHVFQVNFSMNPSKKFSMWSFTSFGSQYGDTAGSGFGQSTSSFVSNSYNVRADYGPLASYSTRQIYSGGSYSPGWGTNINFFLGARSANRFNITTGTDLNGDSIYNDRPAFATNTNANSKVYRTQWGTFDANPQPGEAIIPINYGTVPASWSTSLFASKDFRFGPRPAAPAARAGEKSAVTQPKYRLQFSASFDNLFNTVNPGAPVGVLSSPEFGLPVTLNNNFVTNSAANRSIEFRTAFYF